MDGADVEVVGAEVVVGVEADHDVELGFAEGESVGLGADRGDPVGDARLLDPALVVLLGGPEVGGGDLGPELARQEDGAERLAAAEVEDALLGVDG